MSSLDIAAIDARFVEAGAKIDARLRDELIEAALPLASYLARRFSGRGEPIEDLTQVAHMGLIKAVDRFDPDREVRFSTFATPTIIGELKRHFRDNGWAMHVPRRLKDRVLALRTQINSMTQSMGRAPTMPEIAQATGLTVDEVVEAMEAASSYSLDSLDAPAPGEDSPRHDVSSEDHDFELIERWETIRPYLDKIDQRAKTILYMRFVRELTQSEIGEQIGCSQMHVSRLLTRTLEQLRELAEERTSI